MFTRNLFSNRLRYPLSVQYLVPTGRRLPCRSLFPNGFVQLYGRAQKQTLQTRSIIGKFDEKHNQEFPAWVRIVRRERNPAVREYGASVDE